MDQAGRLGPFGALTKLWSQLSGPQRVVVAAFGAASVAVVLLVAMVASRPAMSVLFSGLEQADAGAIVQKLTEQKVPYKLSADGATIEVPSSKADDLRIQLATQGLPQGGTVGFEQFDKGSFGATEFTERVNYQRAIQGELTRSICQLAPVVGARVHIAMPEETVYAAEQEPTTASVVLKLRRGTPLSDQQVGGIVHLVSSAVEGLKPSNVTVIDSEGNVLSEAGDGASHLLTSNQSKMKRQYESDLAQNLQSMLTRIVGPDKAVVRVSADLSFDQKQTKSESYQPAQMASPSSSGVLLSEEKTTENYTGGVVPPSGLPARRGTSTKSAGDTYSRTESSNQYEVTKTIEETVSAPGKITRLSVAVLVDDKVEPSKTGAITEAVRAAAGIDSKRGDQVTVQRIAFDTVSQKKAEAEIASASKSEMMTGVAKNAGAVVLLLAFLFLLRSTIKQIKLPVAGGQGGPAMADFQPVAVPQGAGVMDSASAPAAAGGETKPAQEPLPPELAKSNPEDLARLVRSWMSEK